MITCGLPPDPSHEKNSVIVIPSSKLSTSQRKFIKAAEEHARGYHDWALDAEVKRWGLGDDKED
jgi:hypothetical protein